MTSVTERCQIDSQCIQPEGHTGPHGFSPAPGLVFAPHGGGEGGIVSKEQAPNELNCDCCGASMMATRYGHGGRLDCSSCRQSVSFTAAGISSVVMARLYPSKMDKTSRLWLEYISYRERELLFHAFGDFYFYLCSPVEHQERVAKIQAEVQRARDEVPEKRWWQFWRQS